MAITYSKNGLTILEYGRINSGTPGIVDAVWSTGQNDTTGPGEDIGTTRISDHIGFNSQLSDLPGDQVRNTSEICFVFSLELQNLTGFSGGGRFHPQFLKNADHLLHHVSITFG